MTPNDFTVLSFLPEDYDYDLFPQTNSDIWVIGKNHNTVIFFILRDGKLHQQFFKEDEQCNQS